MECDVLIIGAGPAGLAAAIYSSRQGLRTVVLEEAVIGGRATYAHMIDNYPGFPEGISGAELISRFAKQAEKFGSIIKPGEGAKEIKVLGEAKEVITANERYISKALVIATGLRQKKLQIPGEEKLLGRGVSYCATCDGFFFRKKKVAVIGGGNEAASDLLYLSSLAGKIVWLVGEEGITADDSYLAKISEIGIEPLTGVRVVELQGKERLEGIVIEKGGAQEKLEVDGAFIAVGSVPTVEILRRAGVEVDEKGFIKTGGEMETNIAGVFAAGDCTGKSHQVVLAAGQGAMAGIKASAYAKMKGLKTG
ncbi:MAG: FAD-dependent oxidoreductase [Candidatus Verstraetearchaeota archaeon]|nr:FAD-dependent oxidoreductase [Candidatus Verstraetearchaeota archaeon]